MTHAVKMTAFNIVVKINRKMLLEMSKKKGDSGDNYFDKTPHHSKKTTLSLGSFLIFSFFIGHFFFFLLKITFYVSDDHLSGNDL